MLFTWHTQDQTQAKLLNILEYQGVPILMKFLQIIFIYFSHTWSVQLIKGVFHLDISVNLLVQGHWVQESIYRHSWRPFLTCHWDLPVSLVKLFSDKNAQLTVLRLLSSARLSEFPYYQTSGYRHVDVFYFHPNHHHDKVQVLIQLNFGYNFFTATVHFYGTATLIWVRFNWTWTN